MPTTFAPLPASSCLLIIDVQERFTGVIPAIAAGGLVAKNCRILLEAVRLLTIPAVISEQVPYKLGPTIAELIAVQGDAPRFSKSHFSAYDEPAIRHHLDGLKRSDVVLAGVETHVCVLATAADLLAAGWRVIIAGDAVASRNPEHRDQALIALRDLGALIVPVESIVFRWQRQAGVGAFKALSQLVK